MQVLFGDDGRWDLVLWWWLLAQYIYARTVAMELWWENLLLLLNLLVIYSLLVVLVIHSVLEEFCVSQEVIRRRTKVKL
jgi:hypothetical protein